MTLSIDQKASLQASGLSRIAHPMAHRSPSSRAAALGVAVLFNAAFGYAVLNGLGVVSSVKLPVMTANVFQEEVKKTPPVEPPAAPVIDPKVLETPMPTVFDFEFPPDDPPGKTAITPPSTPPVLDVGPRGIASTLTIPPYPDLSRRLNETGLVQLLLSIGDDGRVREARIAKSSGFFRLDEAAAAWAKSHWRYRPAMSAGKAVAATVAVDVKFVLH